MDQTRILDIHRSVYSKMIEYLIIDDAFLVLEGSTIYRLARHAADLAVKAVEDVK